MFKKIYNSIKKNNEPIISGNPVNKDQCNNPISDQQGEVYSCDALNNRIVFYNNGCIRPCCRVLRPLIFNNEKCSLEMGNGGPFFIEFDKFSYDDYILQKNKVKDNFSKGIFGGCSCCPSLKKEKECIKGNLIKNIDFAFYSTCNLKCIYCPLDTWYKHSISDFYDDVVKIIDSLIDLNAIDPLAMVTFSGGEPTLLPELDNLCQKILMYSSKISFNFITNGVLLSEPICNLIRSGNQVNMCISIDSGNREGYFKIKGKDCFDKVVANVQKYQELNTSGNLKITLKFIIIEENLDQISSFINLCKQLNIQEILHDVDFLSEKDDKIFNGISEFQKLATENNLCCHSSEVGSQ